MTDTVYSLPKCPFCGGKPHLYTRTTRKQKRVFAVTCNKCGARGGYSTKLSDAKKKWEQRVNVSHECVWTRNSEKEMLFSSRGVPVWDSSCGKGDTTYIVSDYCKFCGGRVRVGNADEQPHLLEQNNANSGV